MKNTRNTTNPGCLASFLSIFKKKDQRAKKDKVTHTKEAQLPLSGSSMPFELKQSIFSQAEISFYHVLKDIISEGATLLAKVRLIDIFTITDRENYYAYFNRVSKKHVDFLLCEAKTMQPVLAIELDDSSHQRADRIERDQFVDDVFESAGLPLVRIPAQPTYNMAEIYQQLKPHLEDREAAPPDPKEIPHLSTNGFPDWLPQQPESPTCPRCGAEMVLRTIPKGEHAGEQIYLCSRYPDCKKALHYSTH